MLDFADIKGGIASRVQHWLSALPYAFHVVYKAIVDLGAQDGSLAPRCTCDLDQDGGQNPNNIGRVQSRVEDKLDDLVMEIPVALNAADHVSRPPAMVSDHRPDLDWRLTVVDGASQPAPAPPLDR